MKNMICDKCGCIIDCSDLAEMQIRTKDTQLFLSSPFIRNDNCKYDLCPRCGAQMTGVKAPVLISADEDGESV